MEGLGREPTQDRVFGGAGRGLYSGWRVDGRSGPLERGGTGTEGTPPTSGRDPTWSPLSDREGTLKTPVTSGTGPMEVVNIGRSLNKEPQECLVVRGRRFGSGGRGPGGLTTEGGPRFVPVAEKTIVLSTR